MKVSVRHAAQIASLHQHAGMKVKDLINMFPDYSPASIYRHSKKPIGGFDPVDKRKFNKGRPSKVTEQDRRAILRALIKLRETEGSFTAPRIAVEAGVARKYHIRTVRNVLNKAGYH